MSKVLVNESSLSSIGNAIREKNGETTLYKPSEMGQAISSLSVGGGSSDNVPNEISISGSGNNLFANNRFNWLIENYADRITSAEMKSMDSMFYACSLEEIPLTLYLTKNSMSNMFEGCNNLKILPTVYKATDSIDYLNYLFSLNNNLREIPDTFLQPVDDYEARISSDSLIYTFQRCYSLRKLPKFFNNLSDTYNFNGAFLECYALDEIKNFPVNTLNSPRYMNNALYHCYRLKDFTFATNEDGTPYTVNWYGFTLDLTGIGYLGADDNGNTEESKLLDYNSGITADKKVSTMAQYNELKNDPDWYSDNKTFSRYNIASAYRTIMSLPDASTYIAENNKTNNTLKLKSMGYPSTSTLSETQIAVATAKGWTVSFV